MNVSHGSSVQFATAEWPSNFPPVTSKTIWPRLNGHQAEWLNAISRGLNHKTYLIQATAANSVVGALPLCFVSGPLFGKFLVSLPYVNTGGVWAENGSIATGLIDEACRLADQLDVKHLELRHEKPVTHPRLNHQRTDKVHLRLPLPESIDALLASLRSKVRSQVRKSQTFGLTVHFGATELLDDFYRVFATNMRDLGTPVFSRRLFESVLECFDNDAELCVIRSGSRAVAAGLIVHANGITEIPSASSLRAYNSMNANMFLYWQMLGRAIERGSQVFDFGRSSEGSGTYRFKTQWGAQPHSAVWQYYVRRGDPADMRTDSNSKQRLVQIWQRLPVWLTRQVGPTIVRGIP